MIKEEVLAMEAGKELDKLVAEDVMEFTRDKDNFWLGTDGKYIQPPRGFMLFGMLHPYSIDVLAAWQVVGKMFELGYAMSLLHLGSEFYPEYWYCDFRLKDSNEPPGYEWVDHQMTAPAAICKAALLAKLGAKSV